MPKSTTPDAPTAALVSPDKASILARVNDYLGTLPTVTEDPTETMLEAIMASETPDNWEKVFQSWHLKDSDKMRLRINAFRPSPSDYEGGLRYFLVLDVTDLRTGEKGVLTCGGTMAVAQVLNAHARVGLPIEVEVVRKPTPTKAGFHPIHFKYIGKTEAPIGDPAAVVSEQ